MAPSMPNCLIFPAFSRFFSTKPYPWDSKQYPWDSKSYPWDSRSLDKFGLIQGEPGSNPICLFTYNVVIWTRSRNTLLIRLRVVLDNILIRNSYQEVIRELSGSYQVTDLAHKLTME